MKSKVVKIIKAVAIVILILGFISGIVWVVFGNSSYTLINFGFMIAIWIGSGLSALIFGWLAYVLEALINIEDNTRGAKVSAAAALTVDPAVITAARNRTAGIVKFRKEIFKTALLAKFMSMKSLF